ncbi:hypothetical protein ACWCXB_05360 [Streptomyces sp. NPDC001514]
MPFGQDEIHRGLAYGVGPDGHWHGWFDVRVRAGALRRLSLHPDQPTATRSTAPPRPAGGMPPPDVTLTAHGLSR